MHVLIVTLVLLPWIAGGLWVVRRGGASVLRADDVRSQAEQLRAFGAR